MRPITAFVGLAVAATIVAPLAAAGLPDARTVPPSNAAGSSNPRPEVPSNGGGERPGAGAKGSPKACAARSAPTVSYVFRGSVTEVSAPAVTIRLSGGNRHAQRLLGALSGKYLKATPVAGTRLTRGGRSAAVTDLRSGDRAIVVYRGLFRPSGWKCAVTGLPSAAGNPSVISGASLARVTVASKAS